MLYALIHYAVLFSVRNNSDIFIEPKLIPLEIKWLVLGMEAKQHGVWTDYMQKGMKLVRLSHKQVMTKMQPSILTLGIKNQGFTKWLRWILTILVSRGYSHFSVARQSSTYVISQDTQSSEIPGKVPSGCCLEAQNMNNQLLVTWSLWMIIHIT